MTNNLRPYATYKDSSVPWLRNVSGQWIMDKHTDFNKLMAEVEKDAIKNGMKLNSKRFLGEIVGSAKP